MEEQAQCLPKRQLRLRYVELHLSERLISILASVIFAVLISLLWLFFPHLGDDYNP